ncbi:hypothetical protein FGG08_002639 [Glutinoglossum americanum]|uniref:Nuclear pore complex protein Nup85 n=1 Tax=Glutinoglossum americanum TaxID=1670608 RepID=A0A9P8I5Y5_9PEZI|nr:hypothetical protein FGG08_002639 [Glutinoglossum americanum]
MSGFAVPFSSSPPATPDSHRRSYVSNPSTTPAGPPPPSSGSFTPAGPPPSSVFGSSQLGLGSGTGSGSGYGRPYSPPKHNKTKTLFAPSGVSKQQTGLEFGVPSRSKNGTPGRHLYKRPGFASSSSPPRDTGSDGDDEDDSMADADVDEAPASGYAARSMIEDSISSSLPNFASSARSSARLSSNNTPRGTKRSRGGSNARTGPIPSPSQRAKSKGSAIAGIIRDLAANCEPASVDENDDVILTTEDHVIGLYNRCHGNQADDLDYQKALSSVSDELVRFWQGSDSGKFPGMGGLDGDVIGIGPDERASPIAKATFLSSLLLQLRHPPLTKRSSGLPQSSAGRSSLVLHSPKSSNVLGRPVALPKLLLDWLNTFHNPYPTALIDLQAHHPNSTAHPDFWNTIYSACLRGKIDEVIHILKEADFSYAKSAKDDGELEYGYRGVALKNIQVAIGWTIQVLQECPSVRSGDWEVRGGSWVIFRLRVAQAIEDLSTFAEGGGQDDTSMADSFNSFSAENFGVRSLESNGKSSLSHTARRVKSKVPWTIYQSLKAMYGILIGSTTEILSFSQDWAEATIALTAWWDGEEDEFILRNSASGNRRSPGFSQPLDGPSASENCTIYHQKLASAFNRVTDIADEDAFQINTLNPIEVGLASIFDGDVEGVIGLLRGWSLTITSAVVEIAGLGGWLGFPGDGDLMMGFDKSDLTVLNFGQSGKSVSKDGILVEYAEGLFRRNKLEGGRSRGSADAGEPKKGRASREGWEIGVQVLGRLEDSALASKKLGDLLEILPLTSSERVDKLLDLCNKLNLASQAWKISEKHADSLAEGSHNYGEALIYYARAHHKKKMRSILDLLISYCLVHSIAYPPEAELDEKLKTLLASPAETLKGLAESDPVAAQLLAIHLSGYATLRKFYNLRDEEANLKPGEKPKLREMACMKEAVAALLAVVSSSTDNIHGGLYDEDRGAVVGVDGLMALLGETLVFVNRPASYLTVAQSVSIMKAIEDLQTTSPRIYAQCEEFFQSTISSQNSPRASLKKTISSMTSASSFSLVGSSMLGSESPESTGNSGVLVKEDIRRGWDWRKGIPPKATGDMVLRILRLELAKELAKVWLREDDGFW